MQEAAVKVRPGCYAYHIARPNSWRIFACWLARPLQSWAYLEPVPALTSTLFCWAQSYEQRMKRLSRRKIHVDP
eukprot:859882-Rhodomonas_salina.1